ncbi:MAG: O-antigen ligase family protein [Thermodesulfovibrionales bacterium]|nr:O-antigen ligase family protein [Thermodesulfovibrionales bacterium]
MQKKELYSVLLAVITGLIVLNVLFNERWLAVNIFIAFLTCITLIIFIKKRFQVKFDFTSLLFYLSFVVFLNVQQKTLFTSFVTADPITWIKMSIRGFILIVFIILLVKMKEKKMLYDKPTFYFLLFAFLACISAIYSHMPVYSLSRGVELLSFIIMSIVIVKKTNYIQEGLSLLYFALSLLIVIIWVIYLIEPSYVLKPRYGPQGPTFHALGGKIIDPNMLAVIAGILFIPVVNTILNKRKTIRQNIIYYYGFAIILSFTLFKTAGRGAILGTLFASIFIFLGSREKKAIRIFSLLCILAPLVFLIGSLYWASIFEFALKGDSIDSVVSLTGRLTVWKDLLQFVFPKSPLIGVGYQMMDTDGIIFKTSEGFTITMAHNSFIQVLIGLGLFGLLILLLSLFFLFNKIFKNYLLEDNFNRYYFLEMVAILIIIMFDCFIDYGIGGLNTPVIIVYSIIISIVSKYDISRKTYPRRELT